MREMVINKQFDEERSLYNAKHTDIIDCVFAGPKDGESVLKEARDVNLKNCNFSLRYPLWHVEGFKLTESSMDEKTRAPIWYAKDGEIVNSIINGTKAVRECSNIKVKDSKIESQEFGWKCDGVSLNNTEITSEYIFFDSKSVSLENVKMKGKYSFQYIDGLTIKDSYLDTKDAFWHSKNITVINSTVKGEYLAWFSEGLTLIDCKIIGTQPLCYCKNLKLINCTMEDTDLSFEYSEVEADIKGHIISVKNPKSGVITADSVGEIIFGDAVMECNGEIKIRE